jgi:hypothetical protein
MPHQLPVGVSHFYALFMQRLADSCERPNAGCG